MNATYAKQAALVIKRNFLPLRTLTYSCGKFIPGIIRLNNDTSQWNPQWDTLARCFASDRDPACSIDLQCRDITRMSRLAGAIHPDTNKRQASTSGMFMKRSSNAIVLNAYCQDENQRHSDYAQVAGQSKCNRGRIKCNKSP